MTDMIDPDILEPSIPGEIPDLRKRPAGCVFAPRCHRRIDACTSPPPEVAMGVGPIARCVLAATPESTEAIE